jgi:catechol 2,3-dioxygenase-like lactoylglutathione lyase family enzyme
MSALCSLTRAVVLAVVAAGLLAAQSPVGSENIMAFIAVKDAKRAVAFYRDTLGLRLVKTEPIALVFDANGTMLRIQIVRDVSVAPYTVLGWQVPDITATVKNLEKAGVTMMRVPSVEQDAHGVWRAPDGTRVAWFKDPEGHTLSVTQF